MRSIIHVDMDAFYASVEQLDDPTLRGQPVIVGALAARGVVVAASYEARQFGVHSAMPAHRARKLCPQGRFVRPRFSRYRQISEQLFALFQQFSDHVEGLSLDEAFLDVGDAITPKAGLIETGRELKSIIAKHTGLSASVGMASNKLLAKLASDYDKPDGFVHIRGNEVRRFLDPLPVGRLWGIGPRGVDRLQAVGIHTCGPLRQAGDGLLFELFGRAFEEIRNRAAGIDERPVMRSRPRRSISLEKTFEQDLTNLGAVRQVVVQQAGKLAVRLQGQRLTARTITLKLRSAGFSTMTRSHSLPQAFQQQQRIAQEGLRLLEAWAQWRREFAIRLVGLGVSGLAGERGDDHNPSAE